MLKRNSFSTFQIKSKCVFLERLSLSLFMSRVPTNYSNSPLPMYQSAFFTNLTNGSPHFRRKQTRNFLTYVYGTENGPIGRTTTRRLSPVFEEITRIRPFLRISRHFSQTSPQAPAEAQTTTRRFSPVFEEITRIRPFLRISRHFSQILRTEAPIFIVP